MARPLRIELAGALYHVMSRGNERRRIVRDDADFRKRIDWLRRTVETCGWHVHAFVVMPNHEHLLVQTPEPPRGQPLYPSQPGPCEAGRVASGGLIP